MITLGDGCKAATKTKHKQQKANSCYHYWHYSVSPCWLMEKRMLPLCIVNFFMQVKAGPRRKIMLKTLLAMKIQWWEEWCYISRSIKNFTLKVLPSSNTLKYLRWFGHVPQLSGWIQKINHFKVRRSLSNCKLVNDDLE